MDLRHRPTRPRKFNLRLQEGLLYQLREEAAANGRSINAEITIRLRRSLKSDQEPTWRQP